MSKNQRLSNQFQQADPEEADRVSQVTSSTAAKRNAYQGVRKAGGKQQTTTKTATRNAYYDVDGGQDYLDGIGIRQGDGTGQYKRAQ